MTNLAILGWGVAAVVTGSFVVLIVPYLSLWLQASFSGLRIGIPQLVLISLRNVNVRTLVHCQVMAVQSGLRSIPIRDMEAQYLAGGDLHRVIIAMIAADRAGLPLDWDTAAAIDLAGRDVMAAVKVSVTPKVIDCPDPNDGGSDSLSCFARDGIQLKVKVRVTVRTNLSKLLGGPTEATVIARVGQGVITAVGTCESYQDLLRDPLLITRQVVANGPDAETAFTVLSIDIAHIDVGLNIGAKLRSDQAEADIRIARATAERRNSMAIARQQEMKALVADSRAKLVLAEAELPAAIAHAFRRGQLFVRRSPGKTREPAPRSGSHSRRTAIPVAHGGVYE